MIFRQLFDRESSTYTYLIGDEQSRQAAIIDPVRELVERDRKLVEELGLRVRYVLDTHVHADHVTGAALLRNALGAKTVVSARAGAPCADIRLEDGAVLELGALRIEARHTPGHTDGDVTYVVSDMVSEGISDMVSEGISDGISHVVSNGIRDVVGDGEQPPIAFTGDTLLIRGCGRTDFQQGDPEALYRSVHEKIFTLPDTTYLYPAHDYKGRTRTTVGEEKRFNPRLGGDRTVEEFVSLMKNLHLAQPAKMAESVPANLQCGSVAVDVAPVKQAAEWAPVARTPEGVPEVDANWLRTHLEAFRTDGNGRLIDVREANELTGELPAIEKVEHIPLGDLEGALDDWRADRDATTPIVLICRSGRRSATAARMLEEDGYLHIASLKGGMIAYHRQD